MKNESSFVMREGWEEKKLGDLIEIMHGYAFESENFKTEFIGTNPIVLTPGNFSEDSKIIFTEQNTKRCYGKFPDSFKFNVGDLVLVMTDLSSKMKILGKPAIIDTKNVLHNQRIGRVRFKDNTLNRDFLYYFFQTEKYLNEIKNSATGTMVKHTAPKRILSVTIFYPKSSEEQKKIVTILDSAFTAIEAAKANIEKNIENTNNLFQSRLNEIFSLKGEGWEDKKLIEINKFIDYRGKTPNKTPNGIRLITAKNVRMGYLKDEPEEFINPDDYDAWMTRGIPKKGDVLFTTEAPLANVTLLNTDNKVALAQRIITLCPNREILSGEYLAYCLQSRAVQDKIISKGTGATVTGIKSRWLKEIVVPIATKNKQVDIVENLDELKKYSLTLKRTYEKKLVVLENLKKSLFQKAFAGELT